MGLSSNLDTSSFIFVREDQNPGNVRFEN
jgi:hypothetical protein